jgi:hypothetical protein
MGTRIPTASCGGLGRSRKEKKKEKEERKKEI